MFDNATLDANTSNAILKDAVERFHASQPDLSKVYIRSDNAGCFHGCNSIFGINSLKIFQDLSVKREKFADPKDCKSISDCRAAHIKLAVRKYVSEGHVKSALDFMHANRATKMTNISAVVGHSPQCPRDQNVKNIMSINRQYEYDIGEGQSR